jgi:hypothetical protein
MVNALVKLLYGLSTLALLGGVGMLAVSIISPSVSNLMGVVAASLCALIFVFVMSLGTILNELQSLKRRIDE